MAQKLLDRIGPVMPAQTVYHQTAGEERQVVGRVSQSAGHPIVKRQDRRRQQ
jgi:hypothetical protein